MGAAVEGALKANPRHVPTLLLLAENHLDGENYDSSLKALAEVTQVNPWHPDAWAFRAVLAHLRHDTAAETAARDSALKFAPANPRVDHLIGRKLSEKYRFAEGAARQRQALKFDPGYLPAKAQLASDLLRLGQEDEGWQLADEVNALDGYDVAAFNLVTLRDTMRKYAALTNAHFLVRMDSREAAIYGPRVLELLAAARTRLTAKYGLQLAERTTVEIFASQKDFGVRTFGMPDNPGYLGVCFGSVITANSPAANRGNPVNWEAVLWHEFGHVVTLTLTKNKMPRWLSEGISTYEERQANPAWGERLTPRYREMILEQDLVPIERLSAAFLTPKTPLHLQFAYYEASLVVEFLIERFGLDRVQAILRDLGEGAFINDALEKHTTRLASLEKDFAEFARAKANALAPGLDFTKPDFEGAATITATNLLSRLLGGGEETPKRPAGPASEAQMLKWAEGRPANYWALRYLAAKHVGAKDWSAAKAPLEKLVTEYPTQKGRDSAYALLTLAHRSLGETNLERGVLLRWVEHDAEAAEANLRLLELGTAAGDWTEVQKAARRYLAVNPLVPAPYRHLARAAEKTGNPPLAIDAWRTQLELDPPNPPDIHFQLARLLEPTDPTASRRHVLRALEDAPRHRDALELLLKLPPGPKSADAAAQP
jgi:tetratricopeptide (TPR) repeat protein